jgi:hypothetical protein
LNLAPPSPNLGSWRFSIATITASMLPNLQ